MGFYDVNKFERSVFDTIITRGGKYTTGKEAYPVGKREYSGRHFRIEDDGSYAIWYANRLGVDAYLDGKMPQQAEWYERRKLGKLHADDSFEFLSCTGQGESLFMTEGMRKYVHRVGTKDGLVVETKNGVHPVFRGLRIAQDGSAVTPYTLYKRKAKRKQCNTFIAQYKAPMAAAFSMLGVMTPMNINEIYMDLAHEFGGDTGRKLYTAKLSDVRKLMDSGRTVDALCLYTVTAPKYSGLMRAWEVNAFIEHRSMTRVDQLRHHYVLRMQDFVKRNFGRDIIGSLDEEAKQDLFEFEEVDIKNKLPSATWGYVIKREDGQPVIRL